jgi:hypothetical protein
MSPDVRRRALLMPASVIVTFVWGVACGSGAAGGWWWATLVAATASEAYMGYRWVLSLADWTHAKGRLDGALALRDAMLRDEKAEAL